MFVTDVYYTKHHTLYIMFHTLSILYHILKCFSREPFLEHLIHLEIHLQPTAVYFRHHKHRFVIRRLCTISHIRLS